jgi:cytochrome c oxidase subunit 4
MHNHSSLRLVFVWLALMLLAAISYGTSGKLGHFDVPFALGIAVAKTALVLLFFMELIEMRFVNVMVCLVSAGFVVLLLSLMVADVMTRHTFPRGPLPVVEETAGR